MPVHFHGSFAHADLATVAADYAVLPSTCHESYGLVLDEAQCLGLPILAADLPAYREHAPRARRGVLPAQRPRGPRDAVARRRAQLAALETPAMPELITPDVAAKALLTHYEAVRVGEHGPFRATPAVDDRRRAVMMFRRAERRLWSTLQALRP